MEGHLGVCFTELQLRHHELCVLVILRLKLMALGMVPTQLCMLAASALQPGTHLLHLNLLVHKSLALHDTGVGIHGGVLKCANEAPRAAPACSAVKDPSVPEVWAWREPLQPAAMLHCRACPSCPSVLA